MRSRPKLGQHWLDDPKILKAIVEAGDVSLSDTILEIGPGKGSLTRMLAKKAGRVIAVELDEKLIPGLNKLAVQYKNLEILQADILKIDLQKLPADYKVVANIPYYLTSNLIRRLAESTNPPATMVLLVQKEVAERITAEPGNMSLLSVSTQLYYKPSLGLTVAAELFSPPPAVDSQIIILTRHSRPLFSNLVAEHFFRVVRAGFGEKRKKLRSSLSGGLGISKAEAEKLLGGAGIDSNLRAQNLSLKQWFEIYKIYSN